MYAVNSNNILSVWKQGTIMEIKNVRNKDGVPETRYQIRFDSHVKGRPSTKMTSSKWLAYSEPANVRLQVGSRIIGIYIDPDHPNGPRDFYAGIVAEPPKAMNKYRYLIFFDDGYASYISHKDIRYTSNFTEKQHFNLKFGFSGSFVNKQTAQFGTTSTRIRRILSGNTFSNIRRGRWLGWL